MHFGTCACSCQGCTHARTHAHHRPPPPRTPEACHHASWHDLAGAREALPHDPSQRRADCCSLHAMAAGSGVKAAALFRPWQMKQCGTILQKCSHPLYACTQPPTQRDEGRRPAQLALVVGLQRYVGADGQHDRRPQAAGCGGERGNTQLAHAQEHIEWWPYAR